MKRFTSLIVVVRTAIKIGRPRLSDRRIRVACRRREAEWRVGLLVGFGDDADVVELEGPALEREALLGPRFEEDVECLLESLAAFLVRDVEARVVAGQPASSDAELEPSLAEVVERRDVLRKMERMRERQHLHRDADLHATRARGDGRGNDERRG